jgi:hypothetical protein
MTDESECRLLYRPGADARPPADGAPRTPAEREDIAEYLSTALMRPLYHSPGQHRLNVEQSLNTMTRSERILLEIEMTERAKKMHSFEYDPLK